MLRAAAAMAFVLLAAVFPSHAELPEPVRFSEGTWDGEVRKDEKCVSLENARLRLTILRKGAYIISVVDKRTGEEFINCLNANKSAEHGIYDRIDENGQHSYRLSDPKHLANHEYQCDRLANGALRFSCQTTAVQVVRTVKLDDALPRARVDVTYTSQSPEAQKMGIFLISQLNLNRAPVSYNHVVAMPGESSIARYSAGDKGYQSETVKPGWWFVADRDSKKSVVMSYPTDGSVEAVYLYRVPDWIHLLPMGPAKLLKKGDGVSLWQEYVFLSGAEDAKALSAEQVPVTANEFSRLKTALLEELAVQPVKGGQPRAVKLPEPGPGTGIEPPLAGKPLASVIVLRNAIYDHPTKLDRQTWLSLDRLLQAAAEIKASGADLLVVAGASSNAVQSEFELTRQAAELSGLKAAYAPNRADAGQIETFEKTLGPKNWVRQVADVTFIAFAPGEEKWLAESIAQAKGRIVVIGEESPPDLAGKTNVTLALCRQNTTIPSFARVGNWPVLHVPHLQDWGEAGMAVVSIFPDYLDVLVKPVGGALGPRLYVGNDGKSRPMGVPPFLKGDPILKVAHISDTQLDRQSRYTTPDGKPQDQENMKKAIGELNALGVDFAINTGDLVNVGSDEEMWKVYAELRKALRVPLYEVMGNHDWDTQTPEGQYVTTNYGKYVDDPLIYDFEKNGVLFVAFGTAVAKGEDLCQRRAKAEKAKCIVLAYHDPITKVKGYNWWTPDLYKAAHELKPTITLAGHTHSLQWLQKESFRELVGAPLAWTKTGDQAWNGFFFHLFYEDKVVSSFKRLGCDDLFFTVVTPYRQR
jgi:predicted phosphodiesterase